MTSINKLIEIKYLNNESSDIFECDENEKDFLEEIKEKFSITEKDLKENKIIFYLVKEKEKKQIDIFKDYNKYILNSKEMIINLEIENKNYNKNKHKKENEIINIENNNINNNLLKSSITKDQIKTILDKNNENLVSNFSNNLNDLSTKINSIEKQMIDINKNIQNVPNLINQTFSIQFPQIEDKINRKLVNIQKMMIGLIKMNKNEINNMLENFNTNLLNTSLNMFNDRNNNNYDILLEDHNKLKEELSNKNKSEADLKTKIKDLEKKIEANNLSHKNKENDYIKKMKDNLNKNKILQENEKKLKNEIYLLNEKINKLNNSNNNFFDVNDNDNKKNKNNKSIKNDKKRDSENNSFESDNNSEEKVRIESDESDNDSKEDDNKNKNKNNKNNNSKISNNNNDNKKFKNILEESLKYEYEFVPKEITYSIEKSKLKEMNNKSVNFKFSIKNIGKTPIPINSYVYNENLVNNNNLFKFYCRISKEIKPKKTEEFIGKMIISNNNCEIKQNYRLVLKLYNNFKKEYSDSKCVLIINILNEKNKNISIIKKLNNQQMKTIIDEINEFFKDNKNVLNKLNLKQEIEDLMKDENFQNFDSFDDLKEKIITEITDKIYS